MTQFIHKSLITLYSLVVFGSTAALTYIGFSYYKLPIEERFFHPYYELLKPSGIVGHGLGVVGTLLIVVGLFGYMARKRMKIFSRIGVLKYWLELHIFLCTLGTILILFHTTFKFGGIISIGFWSLVIVFVSGIVGRFIYIQIPHTIEGRELSLIEIQDLKTKFDAELLDKYQINFSDIKTSRFSEIRLKLISKNISKKDFHKVKQLIRSERILAGRIGRLAKMKNLFKDWHFIHLPFALIMLIIMAVHVAVSLFFGYKWIL
ncbi:MAG: hypothetical protein QM800_13420 [Paludibacter sp.]